MLSATNTDIIRAYGPISLEANETATALDSIISFGLSRVKYLKKKISQSKIIVKNKSTKLYRNIRKDIKHNNN